MANVDLSTLPHRTCGEKLRGATVSLGAVVSRQRDLLEVVLAAHAGGGGAHLLHGRQEHADEDGDDGDHHQHLNEGKSPLTPHLRK